MRFEKKIQTDLEKNNFFTIMQLGSLTPLFTVSAYASDYLPALVDENETNLTTTITDALSDIELAAELVQYGDEVFNTLLIASPVSSYAPSSPSQSFTFETVKNAINIDYSTSNSIKWNNTTSPRNNFAALQITDTRALTSSYNLYPYLIERTSSNYSYTTKKTKMGSYVYSSLSYRELDAPGLNNITGVSSVGIIHPSLSSVHNKHITCIPTLCSIEGCRYLQNITCSTISISSDIIPVTQLNLVKDNNFFPAWLSDNAHSINQRFYFNFPDISLWYDLPDAIPFFTLEDPLTASYEEMWAITAQPTGRGYIEFSPERKWCLQRTPASIQDYYGINGLWQIHLSGAAQFPFTIRTEDGAKVYLTLYDYQTSELPLGQSTYAYWHKDHRAFNPPCKTATTINQQFSATISPLRATYDLSYDEEVTPGGYIDAGITTRMSTASSSYTINNWYTSYYPDNSAAEIALSTFKDAIYNALTMFNNISSLYVRKGIFDNFDKINNVEVEDSGNERIWHLNLHPGDQVPAIQYTIPPLPAGSFSSIDVSNNALTQLDLSNNTNLYLVNCSNNLLTAMDVSLNNIKDIKCNNNELKTLILPPRTYNNIVSLDASNNQLQSLNYHDLSLLIDLNLANNSLTSFGISSLYIDNINITNNNIISFSTLLTDLSALEAVTNITLSELLISENPAYNNSIIYNLDAYAIQPYVYKSPANYKNNILCFARGRNNKNSCGTSIQNAQNITLADMQDNFVQFSGHDNYTLALSANGKLFGVGSGANYRFGGVQSKSYKKFTQIISNEQFDKIISTDNKSLVLSGTDLYVFGNSNKFLNDYITTPTLVGSNVKNIFIGYKMAGYMDMQDNLHISTANSNMTLYEARVSAFEFDTVPFYGGQHSEHPQKFVKSNKFTSVKCVAADQESLMIQTTALQIIGTTKSTEDIFDAKRYFTNFYTISSIYDINGNISSTVPELCCIIAGRQHYIALDSSGNVYGYGSNSSNQLGSLIYHDAQSASLYQLRTNINTPLRATKVCAGDSFTAVLSSNRVYVSGDNSSYQLKDTPGNVSNFTLIDGNWSDVFCTSNKMLLVSAV